MYIMSSHTNLLRLFPALPFLPTSGLREFYANGYSFFWLNVANRATAMFNNCQVHHQSLSFPPLYNQHLYTTS